MTLDELNVALAGKNWTYDWDGLLAVSQSSLQDALTFALNVNTDAFLRPFTGDLWHNSAKGARFQALGLAFGPAQLSFAGQTLRKAQVTLRVPLVAGSLIEVIGGSSRAAELASVQGLAPGQGYWLEWQTDLRLEYRGSELQVVLDLAAPATDVRCNLSALDVEQKHLGEQLLNFLRGGDVSRNAEASSAIPTTQFCLLRLSLYGGDLASVQHGDLLTYQAPGTSGAEGALLVFFNMDSKTSGHLPNPEGGLPYLIADGSQASLLLRNPSLAAWLGNDGVPMLLDGLRPEGQRLVYQDRRVPKDLLLTMTNDVDGRLRITPNAASVAAGANRAFTASGVALQAGTGLWRAAAQVYPSATGAVTAQGLFTNAIASGLHADTGVGKVRLTQVNGSHEESTSAWVYSQISTVLQPGRVFVHKAYTKAPAASLNLYAVASGQNILWSPPELGRLEDDKHDGTALYVPPVADPNVRVRVDYVRASIASGESSDTAVVLLSAPPDFMLNRSYAVNVSAGSPELFFDTFGEYADGRSMNLQSEEDIEVRVINSGGGNARYEEPFVIYTPPAVVTRPADVILIRLKTRFGWSTSFIVVHTLPTLEDIPAHWESLLSFKVQVGDSGSPVYAYQNGYQQIQVSVEIQTNAVTGRDNKKYHFPITAEELESLTLVDLDTGQSIPRLQPGQDGIEDDDVMLAFSTEKNVYAPGNSFPARDLLSMQITGENEDKETRTVRKTLYLHIKNSVAKKYNLHGRFVGNVDPMMTEFNSHTVSPAEGKFTANGKEDKELTGHLAHHAIEAVHEWKGTIRGADHGGYDYSRCDASTTYYELTLKDGDARVNIITAELQEGSSSGMARWESAGWEEGGFSYTGFVPLGNRKVSLPMALIELNRQLRPSMAEGHAPVKSDKYVGKAVPLFNALRSEVAVAKGKLLVTLDRMSDMLWKWPGGTSNDVVKKLQGWRQELETAPVFQLRDANGSLHIGSIGFPNETDSESNRDTLLWLALGEESARLTSTAPTASLHSNAFNFLSFVQGGVDPRTGQYTVALDLPAVAANDLAGPVLPLTLNFSPLTNQDLGFGLGWSLNLSCVDTSRGGLGVIRLGSGESYRIDSNGLDGELLMSERKLVNFRLFTYRGGYRLVHREGNVEYLRNPGFGSQALPERVETPSGFGIKLSYVLHDGNARLHQVHEDRHPERVLLQLDYTSLEATLRFEVTDVGEAARFVFKRQQGNLSEIVLPTADASSWRIGYTWVGNNDYLCVSEFSTPVGARETILYDGRGHGVPGNARPRLPRVQTHTTFPNGSADGTDKQTVEYTWSEENFLGFNGISSWSDEEDNLYRLYRETHNYQYWSEAAQTAGPVRRTVKRTYNGLHLLVDETTRQGMHIQQQVTTHHMLAGKPISEQPAQFQLPKTQISSWTIDGKLQAEQSSSTEYDNHGNLTEEVDIAGITTQYTYYRGDEDSKDYPKIPGCPGDPWKFTRHIHTQTVKPSLLARKGAPVRVTTYTHDLLPALEGPAMGEVVLTSEIMAEQEAAATLRSTVHIYYRKPEDPLTLGRLSETTVTIGGKNTRTEFSYTKQNGEWGVGTVLKTTQRVIGYLGNEKIRHSEQSILNGLMLLERDTQPGSDNIDIRQRYDTLQRVIEETVAPGTDQEATRRYDYQLVNSAIGQASQTVTDVLDVREQTIVDGLARPVTVKRYEPKSQQSLTTYNARYDSLGLLVSATEFDDCLAEGAILEMTELYAYDDWGQRRSTTAADGVTRHERLDPITVPGQPQVKQARTTWQESGNTLSAREVTWLDAAGQTLQISRYEDHAEAGRPYSTQATVYDGLGRKVEEVDAKGQSTNFEYDGFDRLVLTTLPALPGKARAEVTRTYANHSDQDWPQSISIDGKLLGTQTFDDLGRMTEAVTGGRKRTFTFDPGATQPKEVSTPSGATLAYQYLPRLGDEPIRRELKESGSTHVAGLEEDYHYKRPDAQLTQCMSGGVEVLTRDYHSNGRLKTETRLHGASQLRMDYRYSVAERLLSYTDVNKQEQTWEYDDYGRLKSSVLGTLTTTLSYDSLGRDEKITNKDSASNNELTTTLSYDVFGREINREFSYANGTEVLQQTWDEMDRITRKDFFGIDGGSLRKEAFEYDTLGHLSRYRCSGSECPLDPYGHAITEQVFELDALDNHRKVTTYWVDSSNTPQQNVATYHYSPIDPSQLTSIQNTHRDYFPLTVELKYDPDGNLLGDEFGRSFEYDALDRLTVVNALPETSEPSSYYHYDPMDIISARSESGADGAQEGRFYRDGELHTVLMGGEARAIVRIGEHLIAESTSPITNAKEG